MAFDPPAWARATLLSTAIGGLVLFQLGGPALDRQIDADSAGFVLLVRDLVSGSGRLSDWYLGTHLYIFPDAVLTALAFGANGVGVPLHSAITALSAALYVAALSAALRIPALLSALVLSVACILSFAIGGWFETEMMAHLFAPSTHQGSILMGLVALALISSRRPARLVAMFALIALTTMSDVIFIGWGVAPLVLVAASARRYWAAISVAAAGAVGLLGSTIVSAQHATRMAYVTASRLSLSESIERAVLFLQDGASFITPSQGILFYSNVALWGGGAYCMALSWAGRPAPRSEQIIFFATASAGSLLAATVAGLFRGIETARYIMPYIVYGHILMACGVVLLCRRSTAATPALVPASFALALALYIKAPEHRADQLADCLDDRRLSIGAAHYWDVNPLLLAAPELRLLPLEPESAAAYAWNTNRRRLETTGIQFVVSTATLLESDAAAFGRPARITPCADRLILEMR